MFCSLFRSACISSVPQAEVDLSPGKDDVQESSSLLRPERDARNKDTTPDSGKLVKAAFYAVQVFYSFFIM